MEITFLSRLGFLQRTLVEMSQLILQNRMIFITVVFFTGCNPDKTQIKGYNLSDWTATKDNLNSQATVQIVKEKKDFLYLNLNALETNQKPLYLPELISAINSRLASSGAKFMVKCDRQKGLEAEKLDIITAGRAYDTPFTKIDTKTLELEWSEIRTIINKSTIIAALSDVFLVYGLDSYDYDNIILVGFQSDLKVGGLRLFDFYKPKTGLFKVTLTQEW